MNPSALFPFHGDFASNIPDETGVTQNPRKLRRPFTCLRWSARRTRLRQVRDLAQAGCAHGGMDAVLLGQSLFRRKLSQLIICRVSNSCVYSGKERQGKARKGKHGFPQQGYPKRGMSSESYNPPAHNPMDIAGKHSKVTGDDKAAVPIKRLHTPNQSQKFERQSIPRDSGFIG